MYYPLRAIKPFNFMLKIERDINQQDFEIVQSILLNLKNLNSFNFHPFDVVDQVGENSN